MNAREADAVCRQVGCKLQSSILRECRNERAGFPRMRHGCRAFWLNVVIKPKGEKK